MNILLVEDDVVTRTFLETLLRKRGHEVFAFEDAESAWEAASREDIRLAIIDWMLPNVDGLELCRHIRRVRSPHEPVILVMSHSRDFEDVQRLLEAGADDYLAKPLDLQQIEVRLTVAAFQATARRKHYDELRLLNRVLQAMNEAHDLTGSLEVVARTICEATGWMIGEVYLVDPTSTILVRSAACSQHEPGLEKGDEAARYASRKRVEAFCSHTESISFRKGEGLPGLCWRQRSVVWFRDLFDQPAFTRQHLARRAGIGAALAVPILSTQGDVGVLTFLMDRYRPQDEHWVEILNAIALELRSMLSRRHAEAAKVRSEEAYGRLVESSPDAIAVYANGRFIFVNGAGARMLGASSANEIVGRSIDDFIDRAFSDLLFNRARSAVDSEPAAPPSEQQVVRFDGTRVDVEATATPVVFDGRPAVQVILRDITDRKRAQFALRESEEKFRSLVETTNEWIWSTDSKFVMTYNNPALLDILGYEPSELVGRDFAELVHPDDAASVARLLGTSCDQRTGWSSFIVRCQHKNGSWRWLESNGTPIVEDGRVVGFRGADRDITSRVEAEEALRRSEEKLRLSQKMEAVGRLVGGIAHDFNNLLTAILGYADLLLYRVGDDDPSRDEIEEIKAAGERAAALTNQLLIFSRKQVVQPVLLDPNDVVGHMQRLLKRIIGEDIELETRLERPLPLVRLDRGQFEQVIMNLAVNARDAMPHGGRICISTHRASAGAPHRLSEMRTGEYVCLRVSDTGVGMDQATVSRIFEPFFTTKESGKGTGLGLSTVYGIVENAGGSIQVDSEPDKGTTFDICLPIAEEGQTGKPIMASQPRIQALPSSGRVLIVEDEDIVRQLMRKALSSYGFEVLDATDGPSALRLLESERAHIDLVISDVVLPGMSAKALVQELSLRGLDVRILFTSGYTDLKEHDIQHLNHPFLQKPFTPTELVERVREVLAGNASRS